MLFNDSVQIIKNIINAGSAKELSEHLKECLLLLQSKYPNKKLFIEYLNECLWSTVVHHQENSSFIDDNNLSHCVNLYDVNISHLIYAALLLVSVNKISDYKLMLRELIDVYDNTFTEPKTVRLSRVQVLEVFRLLQAKFGIFDILTCKSQLDIFLFNNSHKKYNSVHEAFFDPRRTDTYTRQFILSFASRAEKHDPYQVLIHEVGHALQIALCHKMRMIPQSFIEMNKMLNVHHVLKNCTIEASDVFADVFSAVAMNNSYLAEHCEFVKFFPTKMMDLFERYFSQLLKYASENIDILKYEKLDIEWL